MNKTVLLTTTIYWLIACYK